MKAYTDLGYQMIEVPRCSIEDRAKFIIDIINEGK
jgi:predicted ATPase